MRKGKIVLTTWGSFGDLHPYIALGLELQRRGHHVALATAPLYHKKIESLGLHFHPLRPDIPSPEAMPEIMRRVMDLKTGTKYLFREMLMPHLRDSYDDLTNAVIGADLIVTHPVTFAAPIVAEYQKLRWVSTVLAPASFFSVYDPPIPPPLPALERLFPLGLPVRRAIVRKAKSMSEKWVREVYQLRRQLGLKSGLHPVFQGQHSPYRVLALFSEVLGAPQADWPKHTLQAGFAFYDQRGDMDIPFKANAPRRGENDSSGLSEELHRFLENGEAPLVFTLGSSAVLDAGDFYRESAEAARILGRRAILLAGGGEALPARLPTNIAAFDYAPYSQLFPRATAIVHQGGVGTTGQALRAGKPMLIMPYSHDQPDHAARMKKLGVGRQISRRSYHASHVARELHKLLSIPQYSIKAAAVGEQVRGEDGVTSACNAIEEELHKSLASK